MLRNVLIVCLLVGLSCEIGSAQRRKPGILGGGRRGGGVQIQRDGSSTNRRQDVEGTIWEFKVMDNSESNKSKGTKMTGRMRIKQTSLFAVGKVEVAESEQVSSGDAADMMKQFDKDGDRKLNTSELDALLASMSGSGGSKRAGQGSTSGRSSGGIQSELEGLLSQRIRKAGEEDTGGERIGDMTKSKSSEKTFQFDEDDEHPLSGIVVVQPDSKSNGVWIGRYDEFVNGKKKKRWRFEMRKIEE